MRKINSRLPPAASGRSHPRKLNECRTYLEWHRGEKLLPSKFTGRRKIFRATHVHLASTHRQADKLQVSAKSARHAAAAAVIASMSSHPSVRACDIQRKSILNIVYGATLSPSCSFTPRRGSAERHVEEQMADIAWPWLTVKLLFN